jgi:hypothetical protein
MNFICLDCKVTTGWTDKQVVSQGTPVCPKCDKDMALLENDIECAICTAPLLNHAYESKYGFELLDAVLPDGTTTDLTVCKECYENHREQ